MCIRDRDIEHAVEKLNFLYRQSTDNYITLVASLPPFSSFASFTYMVENGQAVYVSGYAKKMCIRDSFNSEVNVPRSIDDVYTSIRAVSYTHLDVYKSQGYCFVN